MRLILFFMLLAVTAQAQLLTEPAKKSTTVIVVLENTPVEQAYRQVAAVFQDEGFQLEKTDPVLLSIVTDWQRLKGFIVREWQAEASIRQSGDDAHVYMRAKVRQDLKNMPDANAMLSNDGSYKVDQIDKSYNFGKDWKTLESLAAKIGGSYLYR